MHVYLYKDTLNLLSQIVSQNLPHIFFLTILSQQTVLKALIYLRTKESQTNNKEVNLSNVSNKLFATLFVVLHIFLLLVYCPPQTLQLNL